MTRVFEIAELRDFVRALPVTARRVLRQGPLPEPACGVCSALATVDGCASFGEEVRAYHDVGIGEIARLLGHDDLSRLAEALGDPAHDPVLKALAGALAAERCLTIYLLAGWVPPRVRRPIAERCARWSSEVEAV